VRFFPKADWRVERRDISHQTRKISVSIRHLAAFAFVLSACGTASLEDFSTSELSLSAPAAAGRVVVRLGDAGANCLTLASDVRATLNGVPMQVDSRGGEQPTDDGWICQSPQFSIELSQVLCARDALLVLEDETARIRMDAQNVFATRTLEPTRFEQDGRRIEFLWSPGTDRSRSASWQLESGTRPVFGEATIEGERVVLDLPAHGGTLRMSGAADAPVLFCEGVASCAARVSVQSGELAL
jgi:hypothetical protein